MATRVVGPDVPKPAVLALARKHAAIAAIAAVGAVASFAAGLAFMSPLLAASAIIFATFGWLTARDAWGSALSHAALQEITRGRFENVTALHARIPARSLRRGSVMRAIAYQRALLALYRGAPDEAVALLAPAIAPATGVLSKTHERMQIAGALALRAFAHASRGDAAAAEADAARAEAMAEATGETLARAELARAVVLARRGGEGELARHLARTASLMLESSLPRERALVRALRRLARSRARSVYREPAKPSEPEDAGRVADWIAQIAPEAAAHARGDTFAERLEQRGAPAPTPAALEVIRAERREAARDARPKRRRAVAVAALAVVALTGAILGAGRGIVAVAPPVASSPDAFAIFSGLLGAAFVTAFAFGWIAFQVARARRLNAPLLAANRALAAGDDTGVERLAGALTKSTSVLFAAAGHAALGSLAERRADFATAKDAATRALSALGGRPGMRAAASAHLLPSIVALRAISLAALGRADEARAELATLLSAHGGWSHAAATELRVRLLVAVTSGDLDAARAVARERTAELPIPLRDDVLADLVIAVGPDGFSSDERERLAAELDDDARLRAWIDVVAPGLRDRFAAAAAMPRVRVEGPQREEARLRAPLGRGLGQSPSAIDERDEMVDDAVDEPVAARAEAAR